MLIISKYSSSRKQRDQIELCIATKGRLRALRGAVGWIALVLCISVAVAVDTARPSIKLQKFRGKDFGGWVADANRDFDGFGEAVEFWGVAAVPEWIELLGADKSMDERSTGLRAIEVIMRIRTINTLRAIGPSAKNATSDLLAILGNRADPDSERFSSRAIAAAALGSIGEPPEPITLALASALRDEDAKVRRAAVSALGSMSWRASSATNEIVSAMRNGDVDFRAAAEKALREISRPRPLLVGDRLPEIEAHNLTDNSVRPLGAGKGNILVLDFWSSECPPCQPAMNHLNDLASRRRDWVGKVRFVGVNEDESAARGRAHAQKKKWQNLDLVFDFRGTIKQLFRSSLPELVVVNGRGTIVWRGHPTDIDLEAEIKRLLETDR